MTNCPAQAGETATMAKTTAEHPYQRNLAAYEAEQEWVKFDQTALKMQYKASFTHHKKRRAAYARNVTRAYDLLLSQYCGDVMKEQLETQPDYDTNIRDKPIAVQKPIKVLAHNPTRGRYHYACIYKSLERKLNIQQKDNKTIVTYKDTFEQNVEVLKMHLPVKHTLSLYH